MKDIETCSSINVKYYLLERLHGAEEYGKKSLWEELYGKCIYIQTNLNRNMHSLYSGLNPKS